MNTNKSTIVSKREIDTLWKVVRALIARENERHEAIEKHFEALRVKIYKTKKKEETEWQSKAIPATQQRHTQSPDRHQHIQSLDQSQQSNLQERFLRWQNRNTLRDIHKQEEHNQ